MKDSNDGSANGSAFGRYQSHKVRKIANEQGKGCEQSYNLKFFIKCGLITLSF